MNIDTEFGIHNLPCFLGKTEILMKHFHSLTYEEAKALWKCNDKIARTSFGYFLNMCLTQRLTPAILAYEGIQYFPKIIN